MIKSFALKPICTGDFFYSFGVVEKLVGQAFFKIVDAPQMRGLFLFIQGFFFIEFIFEYQILLFYSFVGLFERVTLCFKKCLFLLEPHL